MRGKKPNPQIKRAGDAKPQGSGQPQAPAPVDENRWTSSPAQGGNVLNWLAQKTQGQEPQQSRGAVEYLSKQQKAAGKDGRQKSGSPTPVPRKEQQAKAGDAKPAGSKPQSYAAAAAAGGILPKPRSQGRDDTPAAAAPSDDAIKKLSKLFPEKVSKASALAAAESAPKGDEPQRGVRGRRRRDDHADRHEQRRQREREQEEEAREKHDEAMRTDPEYQKRFQSFQELQQEMQSCQMQFFEKYSRQQNLMINHVITERLDIPVILDLIDQHDVVFICTDTGSGKSTNVPKALLELSPETKVVSTQPRRTATVAIANRVASLRRERVGEDVGYWIRGEKKGDEQTRLWYMTSYTLLLRLLENPSEMPYTHIVLDEFHERQPDIEVIVALLRLALLNKTSKFKLILMSATLNTEDWEEYFAGLKVASYKQSEPEHPIHDYFLEDMCTLLGADYQAPAKLAEQAMIDKGTLDKHVFIAQNLIGFLNSCSNPNHAILVFLPGRAQVEMMQMWLQSQMPQRVDVVPWHSAVDLSEIEAAMKRHIPNRQKIYLATDIAECSITLPDVVFVIDLVLVKRPKITKSVSASILYPPLVTQWISKGSIAQRRGRIGRVQQGFYFCIFPAAQIADLPEHAQPPIENARIDELALHCLQVVSNPVALFTLCHGQPHAETIASAMNTLTQLGCILNVKDPLAPGERVPEIYNPDNRWNAMVVAKAKEEINLDEIEEYQYTFIGRILQLIPVSPQPGMLVFFGFLTGLESLMILAAAVTSSLSPFTTSGNDAGNRRRFNLARAMEETENVMRDLCCGLRSDIVAVMKATLLFRIEVERHAGNAQTVRQWCAQKNLSYDKLLAIVDFENHIKFELASFMPFRDVNEPTRLLEQLDKLAAMVAVMTNVAFVSQSLEVTSEGNTYANTKEMALGVFSDLSAVPDVHSPSCLRWQEGDIIIPVQLTLLFDKLLASFSTAIASPKQFWMSLLLFSERLNYATFSDDEGTFHVFALSYCGRERYVELDEIAGYAALEFRRKLCGICEILRLSHANKQMFEDDFNEMLQHKYNLKSLQDSQREVITALVTIFKNLEDMAVDEVEHDEDDLDIVSILSFALPVV